MPTNTASLVRGCAAHGAVFYELDVPTSTEPEWFTSAIAAKGRRRKLAKRFNGMTVNDMDIYRVTLTARLTPKRLALALLLRRDYAATREKVE